MCTWATPSCPSTPPSLTCWAAAPPRCTYGPGGLRRGSGGSGGGQDSGCDPPFPCDPPTADPGGEGRGPADPGNPALARPARGPGGDHQPPPADPSAGKRWGGGPKPGEGVTGMGDTPKCGDTLKWDTPKCGDTSKCGDHQPPPADPGDGCGGAQHWDTQNWGGTPKWGSSWRGRSHTEVFFGVTDFWGGGTGRVPVTLELKWGCPAIVGGNHRFLG